MAKNNTSKPAYAKLTHPDKVLYASEGITKQHLADYLQAAAPFMLPFLEDHPLSLVRCPDGCGEECFFQKHPVQGFPDAFKIIQIREQQGELNDYMYIHDETGLFAAAQMSVIELHVWGATINDIEKPDRLVFDLDPDASIDFGDVKGAAIEIKEKLKAAGLISFPLLTGGKGIHIIAPLARRQTWDVVKAFAENLARTVAAASPSRYVAKAAKAARKGKIFIDWLRNERGATAIAPYSPRARAGAPVAMPVSWEELEDVHTAAAFSIKSAPKKFAGQPPWPDYFEIKQEVPKTAGRN